MTSARRRALIGLLSLALVASAQTGIATGASAATADRATTAAALAFTASPAPTITGAAEVGSTLTAVTGTWTPAPGTFLYRWSRDGVAIQGATRPTYALVAADQGARITVAVTAVKTRYASLTRTSEPTAAVAPKGGSPVVAQPFAVAPAPTITGTVAVGSDLTAVTGAWSPVPRFAYQWFAGSTPIRDATAATFTPTRAELGQVLTVSVAGYKDGYVTTTRMSAGTTVAQGTFTAPPFSIRGEVRVGSTLDAYGATFTPGSDYRSYIWYADDVRIEGETSPYYTPVAADVGKRLTVTVTAAVPGITPLSRTSIRTAPVAPAATTPPQTGTVSGRAFLESVGGERITDGSVDLTRDGDFITREVPIVGGSFEATGLAPGQYVLAVSTVVDGQYLRQYYGQTRVEADATRVTVAADGTVRVDIVLVRYASISGTVTQSDGQPAVGSYVEAFRVGGGGSVTGVSTDEAGRFTLGNGALAPGRYELRFGAPFVNPEGFIGEWYGDTDDRNRTTRITVVGNEAITGIDAQLTLGSRFAGIVRTGAAGEEYPNVYLVPETAALLGADPRTGKIANVDASGRFEFRTLTPGRYYLYAEATRYEAPSYRPQWVGGTGTLATATVFTVRRGEDLPSVDVQLATDSSVTTQLVGVTAPGWQDLVVIELLQDGVVKARASASHSIRGFAGGLEPGTYRVRVTYIRDNVWTETWWDLGTGADRSELKVGVDRSVTISVRAAPGRAQPAGGAVRIG